MQISRMKIAAYLAVLLIAMSQATVPAQKVKRAPLVVVHDRGSMSEVLKDNGEGKIQLSELKNIEHLYALGPLSKLRGEIIIWDSEPFESRSHKGQVQVKSDWNEQAAFLVWASVPKWRKIKVPPAVRSVELLDAWLDSMSGGPNTPLRSQYPFILKGHFGRISWYLANVQDDRTPLSAQKHHMQRFFGQSKNLQAQVLGFYSPAHQGIFIPQGRHCHMHVKVGQDLVAHLDDFDPHGDSGLTLYVPGN